MIPDGSWCWQGRGCKRLLAPDCDTVAQIHYFWYSCLQDFIPMSGQNPFCKHRRLEVLMCHTKLMVWAFCPAPANYPNYLNLTGLN